MKSRDVAIALSLANLCFVRLWAEIFCASHPTESYYLKVANVDFLAAALNVLLFAALFLAGAAIARRFSLRPLMIAGFIAVLAHQLNFVDPGVEFEPGLFALPEYWAQGRWLDLLGIAAAFGAAIFIGIRWPKRSLAFLTGAVQLFATFLVITFGRAAWIVATVHPKEAFASVAPPIDAPVPDTDGPRVVVLLFDAMGRGLAFDERPDGVALPELDRLRAQSIDATQVTQAGPLTKISIPSITTGQRVKSTKPSGRSELLVTTSSGEMAWTRMPTLFHDARELGGATVVAGWYHPYCRMFPELSACSWYPTQTVGSSQGQDTGLLETMLHQQIDSFLPYVNRPLRQIDNHKRQVRDVRIAVTQGKKGLVFVSMIVAHLPWIWEDGEFTATSFAPSGYFDQLELVDLTLGDLRREMEAKGKWTDTALLVTSDHVGRVDRARDKNDKRVPFILKLPGQARGVVYDKPLDAIVIHDLVKALLRGELTTPEAATTWLDAQSAQSL